MLGPEGRQAVLREQGAAMGHEVDQQEGPSAGPWISGLEAVGPCSQEF